MTSPINFQNLKAIQPKDLHKESTSSLARMIVDDSDFTALKVLLETRRLFRLKKEGPFLLPEFLLKLRNNLALASEHVNDPYELADCAYDLTLAKFWNLPKNPIKIDSGGGQPEFGIKTDCRNYYRQFLKEMQKKKNEGKIRTPGEEELIAGKVIKNLVYRAFLYSKLECMRRTPFVVRYLWEIKGKRFYLWYPSYLTAKEFRGWLKENIGETVLAIPDAQKHIQGLIAANFNRGHLVPVDTPGDPQNYNQELESALSYVDPDDGPKFPYRLASAVAKEKGQKINKLRSGIAKMGRKTVEQMVLEIFSDLSVDDFNLTRTAKFYGISKPTLSRFAGSKWSEKNKDDKPVTIPDLWKNTARILSKNSDFMETVLTAGFGDALASVLVSLEAERA